MPEMDGLTFINQIKLHFPKLSKIPIALGTAMDAINSSLKARNEIILIPEPMDLDNLLKLAHEYCF